MIRKVALVLASLSTLFLTGYSTAAGHKVLTLKRVVSAHHQQAESPEPESLRDRDHLRNAHILRGGIPKISLLGTFRDPYIGGLYYTTIKIGSPPRKFHVQIDTGTNNMWVNCKSCSNCPWKSNLGFRPNLFNPDKSSSARPVLCFDQTCITSTGQCTNQSSLCQFSQEYGNGGGSFGYYLTDLLEFDVVMPHYSNLVKNTSARVFFGCSTYLSGGFTQRNQAIDGILGLGYLYPSIVLQLATQLMIPNIFSHCLGRDGNGTLVLGEFDHGDADIVYTPLVQAPYMNSYYSLDLKTITVKGKSLPINPTVYNSPNGGGTIVDSGTSLTYFVSEAYESLINAINNDVAQYATPINYNGTICYKISSSKIHRFPLITLEFAGNASMVLKPEDYILPYPPIIDGVPSHCIGFHKTMVENLTILGDLVLKDKIIIYDIDRRRLGWSSYYNCSAGIVSVSPTSGSSNSIVFAHPMTITRNLFLMVIYLYVLMILI